MYNNNHKKTKILFDLETTGLLDNLVERILCICAYNVDTKEEKCFISKEEETVIKEFYDYVNQFEDVMLLGYNTDSFDMPFLVRRSVVYGLKIPKVFTQDLRKIVNGFSYSYNRNEKGKLRDWAVALNIPVNTLPGAEMFGLYARGEFDKIKEHCLEDIKITKALFERAEKCGLI